jgi:hypothetical protein
MDEDEYKATYDSLNPLGCPFEKVILSRQCDCQVSTRIFIAERQAVGCANQGAQRRCIELLGLLHRKATFALKHTGSETRLPHAQEMKVQAGGLLGIQAALNPEAEQTAPVADIHGLIDQATAHFGDLDTLPYSDIVRHITAYVGRRSTRRGR